MGTVRQQIENCSSNICKNIEIYGPEILSNSEESSQHKLRGSLAQNILAQLRHLVEAVAVGHALDGNLEAKFAFKDEKGSVSKHVRKCKGSLFRSWENLSTLTSGKSERINHLACFSLLTETSHVWGR